MKKIENTYSQFLGDGGATILLVDDDDALRALIRKVLVQAGYQVIELADGTEVIETISRKSPDLLMTDILMPNQEGMETIELVQEKYPQMPIIVISTSELYLEISKELGVNGAMLKPLNFARLISMVEENLPHKSI